MGYLTRFFRAPSRASSLFRLATVLFYLSFVFITQNSYAQDRNTPSTAPGQFTLYDIGEKLLLNIKSGSGYTSFVINKDLVSKGDFQGALQQQSGVQFVVADQALVAQGEYSSDSQFQYQLAMALTPYAPDGIQLKSSGPAPDSSNEPSTGAQILAGVIIALVALGSFLIAVVIILDWAFDDSKLIKKVHKKLSKQIDDLLEEETSPGIS